MVLTSQDIISLQLKIFRCGYVNLSPKWNKTDGKSRFSRLYLVEEGSGYLKAGAETILLEPGYVYLIPANFPHAYGCTKLKKLYFMFNLTSRDNADILSSLDRICRIRCDSKDLQILLEHYRSTELVSLITVRQKLLELVCRSLQENKIPPISLSQNSSLVKKALAYIHTNLRVTLTIREISGHLFVSESKLRSAFLAETGVTIGQYIDGQVMLRAKQLLAGQSRSIGEISAILGFCDQFYFSRLFKAKYGLPPSAYRKNFLKTAAK